jgi:hypothetical protein
MPPTVGQANVRPASRSARARPSGRAQQAGSARRTGKSDDEPSHIGAAVGGQIPIRVTPSCRRQAWSTPTQEHRNDTHRSHRGEFGTTRTISSTWRSPTTCQGRRLPTDRAMPRELASLDTAWSPFGEVAG